MFSQLSLNSLVSQAAPKPVLVSELPLLAKVVNGPMENPTFPDFRLNYAQTVVAPAEQKAEADARAAQEAAQAARELQLAQEAAYASQMAQMAPTPVVARGNGYDYGQCTYYVAGRRAIPGNWGNARDWLFHAQAMGYATGPVPRPGAIAWSGVGYYGHVAYVEEVAGAMVRISEMNNSAYGGWNIVDTYWTPITSFFYIL